MTQNRASIGGHQSQYLGLPFITLKTEKNMACSEEELGDIYKIHEKFLAGWGEVPYATPPHRITEHADVIIKPGVVGPDPDETMPKTKNKPNSKHAGKLKFGSMAYRPSNQPKSSQPKSKPEKPDQRWDFGYDNPVTPDGGVLKHKDVSSGSKLRPRDPDPKPPSCPTTDHNITITIESFDEKRKICQSPNTSLEEIGTRCYTRNTTGCSQGEGVNIYLIETGLDDNIAGDSRPLNNFMTIGPDHALDLADIPVFRYQGTAMFSLISHRRLGYAPKADVMLLKYYNKYGYYTTAHLFNAMLTAFDEIMENGVEQAIISCAAWAPGEGIHVAGPDYNGNPGVELATGASFAVGIVVGLLASYISEGVPITKVIQHLYDLAWPRVPGGPNIVWNGVEKDEWPGGIPHLPPPRPPGY
ncbi:hypothetical protein TWF106_008905 [Orbilia oligospora]|uniref:Peptidase S8/S53 domain-containing protein n=1 Tax=Orbilia oligospora TaxID=2813651 RepID=A0A7C8UGY4_ORBOL|nr:hypothetical protein TWF106_008905 [Orbilia oligospora]